MTAQAASAGIRVPIVVFPSLTRPKVLLQPVVAGRAPHPRAYKVPTRVDQVTCADLLKGREQLVPAQILAPTVSNAQVALVGRSYELAMALATLGEAYGARLGDEVVATGALDVTGSGSVQHVDYLEQKLRRALEALHDRPGARVLYPASQKPGGGAAVRLDDATLADLCRHFPLAADQLTPVDTLDQAAQLVFGGAVPSLPTAPTRLELERLRYERANAADLFRAAGKLFLEAGSYSEVARLGVVLRYHALTTATHAAQILKNDLGEVPEWPSAPQLRGDPLREHLKQEAERLEISQGDKIPGELRAEHLNFLATACFTTLDFLEGERLTTEGLDYAGEGGGQASEARKLRGTRALFRWRLALRALGTGSRHAARHHLRFAHDDLKQALREAMQEGVENRNDRARVRLYGVNLQQIEAAIAEKPDLWSEEIEKTLREVLGWFWDAGEQSAPQQEPGWGLHLLYAQRRAEGRWQAILDHWRAHRDRENPEAPAGPDGARPPLRRWIFTKKLPCNVSIAALLLEAAIECGDREVAEESADAFSNQQPVLIHLGKLWPAVWAPPDWKLDAVGWVRDWADGNLELPPMPAAAAEDDWLLARLDELRECWSANDRRGAARARRRLQLWLGEHAAPVPPVAAPEARNEPRLVIEKGKTRRLSELPPRSVALDGYVQGPGFDTQAERYSLDHHAGCVRHATLSTCEMTADALRVGLDPSGMTVFVNDLDADTILSSWLLARPAAAKELAVDRAVRDAGRHDALGPAARRGGLAPALRWALEPVLGQAAERKLRGLDEQTWRGLLDECFVRLDEWHRAGAPRASPRMCGKPLTRVAPRTLHRGEGWLLAESPMPHESFAELYARGERAAVITREAPNGTHEYTVGKATELVGGFDVPAILEALRRAELEANPSQSPGHTWGGGTTIGGSPRNPDGSASVLTPERVAEEVEAVLRGQGR